MQVKTLLLTASRGPSAVAELLVYYYTSYTIALILSLRYVPSVLVPSVL